MSTVTALLSWFQGHLHSYRGIRDSKGHIVVSGTPYRGIRDIISWYQGHPDPNQPLKSIAYEQKNRLNTYLTLFNTTRARDFEPFLPKSSGFMAECNR